MISFVNKNNYVSTSSATITLNKPTDTAENDVMIVAIAIEDTTDRINSVPSGWNLLLSTYLTPRTQWQYVYWKLAGASEPSSYAWGLDSADEVVSIIATFRGIDPEDPIGNYQAQVNDVSTVDCTAPSVNVETSGNWVLHIASNMFGTTWTAPTGSPTYTEREDVMDSGGAAYLSISLHSAEYTSTGATGTKIAVAADADYNIGSHVELRMALGIIPIAAYAVCNKINPQIGSDPYLLASVFRQFPSQELEDYEFEDEQQGDPLFWVEDKPGLAADDIIDDFFEYSGIPEPLVVIPAAINAVCSKVDPTIPFVTLFITPAALNTIASRNNPVIRLYITPAAINAIGSRNNPSILVTPALTVTPAAISAISSSVNPSVVIPVMVVPAASYAVAGRVNPTALMPLEIAPAARYAIAGKLDPTLPIVPAAVYVIAGKKDPNVPINSIPVTVIAGRVNPKITVTPPLVISFEMWAHSVTMVEGPFVFTNPEFITPQPIYVITGKVNPVVYILGGPEFVLPDPIYVIVGSIDPKVIRPFLEILELRSNIQTELEFMSMVKTELELDSLISTELELKSKIPYRQEETESPVSPGGILILDVGKLDEGKLG